MRFLTAKVFTNAKYLWILRKINLIANKYGTDKIGMVFATSYVAESLTNTESKQLIIASNLD